MTNIDNLENIICESRRFQEKAREYLKQLLTKANNRHVGDMYKGVNKSQKGYQPIKNMIGDLLADFHNILNRWKNLFSQLVKVHRVGVVKHFKIRTDEP